MQNLKEKIILFLPIPVFFISISVGKYYIGISEAIDIILYKLTGYTLFSSSLNPSSINVLWNVRLPRVLLAMLVGSSLSVSGASFQAILRNPLVDPYILGLSSAAAFGAALSMAFLNIPVQISAFLFACLGVLMSYFIARDKTGEISITSLILSGVLVSSVFTSFLAIVELMVNPLKLQGIVYWTMGSFHTSNWKKVGSCLPYMIIGSTVIFALRWKLNILSLGEREAKTLGINPEVLKLIVIISSTLLASSSVSVCGIIGLVGLMIPHILRMLIGPDNRKIIPLSMTLGSSYLLLVDDLSRNLLNYEIPIGIFTTLLGAPFFVVLLRRSKGGWI